MYFLTTQEAAAWCTGRGVSLDANGDPQRPHGLKHHVRGRLTTGFTQLTALCNRLEHSLPHRGDCLVWMCDLGVWPSSENYHLYYRLRESYGDRRQVHEAPGHVLLDFERADLVSLLQIGLICGWDIHVVTAMSASRLYVSHDEYLEYGTATDDPSIVATFTDAVSELGVHFGAGPR